MLTNKKLKIVFSMILILIICIICKKNYSIVGPYCDSISYGIGILLVIWQWMQYIIPIVLSVGLIILNLKKLNYKKIIIFIVIGILVFVICYFIGELILKNNTHIFYRSGVMDMIEYNGKMVYVHK